MGKKLWTDKATGAARACRRLERVNDSRLDAVYTGYRLLEANEKHHATCDAEKDADGFCSQDRIVASVVAKLLVGKGVAGA